MTAATRERKVRFIQSFGPDAERKAVLRVFSYYGLDMLTDEMVDLVTSDMVHDALSDTRRTIRNRKIYQAELAS